jgi:hypothetical protein
MCASSHFASLVYVMKVIDRLREAKKNHQQNFNKMQQLYRFFPVNSIKCGLLNKSNWRLLENANNCIILPKIGRGIRSI